MSEMDQESPFDDEPIEADPADAAEQRESVRGAARVDLPSQVPLDANEADALEQRIPVRDEAVPDPVRRIPPDANEADVAEQAQPVNLDDDDYR